MAWGKAGSSELTSSASEVEATISANKCNQILNHVITAGSGNIGTRYRFNDDSGSKYAQRYNHDGGSDGTNVNQAQVFTEINDADEDRFQIGYMVSVSGEAKLGINFLIETASGAGNAPQRSETVFKYVPSPDATITSVKVIETVAGSFGSNTNLSVLGSDVTPAVAVPVIENVQDNSLFVEKENARRYWFDGTNWIMQPTLEDDFSSDNFNDSGTKIGVANNTLEWDGAQNGSVHGSTIDLTSIDTKAVFRAKLRINTLTAPSSASSFILIGFSDSDHTTAGDSSQDGIGLIIQNDADLANTFRAMHVDGAVFSPNAGTAFATVPSTATDYFIEVVLDVNTWYVRIYSDSDYSTLTEEESGSLTATGLRYFGIKMRSSASVGGTFDGYIDDLKFYNGVTSIN